MLMMLILSNNKHITCTMMTLTPSHNTNTTCILMTFQIGHLMCSLLEGIKEDYPSNLNINVKFRVQNFFKEKKIVFYYLDGNIYMFIINFFQKYTFSFYNLGHFHFGPYIL